MEVVRDLNRQNVYVLPSLWVDVQCLFSLEDNHYIVVLAHLFLLSSRIFFCVWKWEVEFIILLNFVTVSCLNTPQYCVVLYDFSAFKKRFCSL